MTTPPNELSTVLILLMKGIFERDASGPLWQSLLTHQARVRDHIAVLGLELMLDEAEGFAFLRQRAQVDDEPELPRLVARRQLGFSLSLMLALLRKSLAEHDARGGDTRLVLTAAQILDLVRLFQPDTANEAKMADRVDRDITKVVELGFLRQMKGREQTFEVRRILRSFVDAQWLGQLNERLAAYVSHGETAAGDRMGAAND